MALEIASDLPRITTDPRRVTEILGNLLSNAFKYTPAGGRVWVRVRVEETAEPEPALIVQVQDTEPGIPVEAQERMFKEFQRGGQHTADGSGLGLAISRRMARLLGGELTVKSRIGEGATFSLWFPLSVARDTVSTSAQPA